HGVEQRISLRGAGPMTRPSALLTRTAASVGLVLALAGCGTNGAEGPSPLAPRPSHASASGQPSGHHSASPHGPASDDPYINLADALHRRGVDIWFETDLVASWLAGPQQFQTTLHRLKILARVPGVVGFKVADELGYHDGLSSPTQALAFLRAAHQGLAR